MRFRPKQPQEKKKELGNWGETRMMWIELWYIQQHYDVYETEMNINYYGLIHIYIL